MKINANFIQVIPDSQWFTKLEQIKQYAIGKQDRYLEIAIQNTISKGGKLEFPEEDIK